MTAVAWWIHGTLIVINMGMLTVLLRYHRRIVRAQDWLTRLNKEYCERHGIPFIPLDNGD
jgi:hypothetical protein